MPVASSSQHEEEPQLWTPPQRPLGDSFLGSAAVNLPSRLSRPSKSPRLSANVDSETQFFLREARVTKDTLVHLTEDDDGFDDMLFLKCQGFLKSHTVGVSARRKLRAELQAEAVRTAARRRHVTRMSRIQQFVDDPRSSRGAFYFFVFIATLVVVSCVTTIASTLPAYNPIVKDEYLLLWNVVDLILGGVFTIETGLRLVACVFDRTLPTSTWQNAYRFFTKPSNLIDLVSITPSYVQLFVSPKSRVITGTLRTVRLLRLFKILRFYKPVRMLQKALRFAAKGLLAPMLFLVTTLIFISAGVYFAEHGDYDEGVHEFLIDPDPVCTFEPSYFLSLAERAPEYLVSQNTSTAAPTTMAPIWDTLPPAGPGSSSSSSTWGSKDTERLPDAHGQAYIDRLDCPVSEATFVTIVQSSWWAIATMSTAGFGDFVTVTGVGRVLAVFGILAGIILNAMPIAVIDASFVATLQTEEDQDAREKAKKQQMDANVKLGAGRGATGSNNNNNSSIDGMAASVDSLFLNDALGASNGGDDDGPLADLGASFLGGKNASFYARSIEMEDKVREQQLNDAATPRTHVEVLLLHLHLLSRHDVIDLANPSDEVLYLLDVLLEAAVTNTAVDVAQWQNRHMRTGGAWTSATLDDGSTRHRAASMATEAWSPSPQVSLPLWVATTETNLAREAQAAGHHTAHPLGERREMFSERYLLSKPVRWTLGARGLGNADNNDGGDTGYDDAERRASPTMLSRSAFGSQRRPAARGSAHQQDDDGVVLDTHACILDAGLLKRLQRSRSDAIARTMLLGGGGGPQYQQWGHERSRADVDGGGRSRRRQRRGSMPGLRASSIISRTSSEDNEGNDDDSGDSDDNEQQRQVGGGHRRAAPTSALQQQLRLQPMELLAILEAHCWLVLHQAWGRTHTLLIPRRPPSALPIAPCGAEEEPMTVQILRYNTSTAAWEAIIPFVVRNAIALSAPPGTAHNFRCRVSQTKNRLSVGAPLLCNSREHAAMHRNVPVSTYAEWSVARQLLSQVRQRSHYDVHVALGKQLAASRMTYRAQRIAKEQQDAKKARSAKAKKDAETRELLDALSSEKKEAYAILQRLDMEVGEAASSDRLSLLALASTAADRLERERTAERNIALRRFALMERIAAEEQSPRYRLVSGDVILFFGGSSSGLPTSRGGRTSLSSARHLTAQIASVLPSRDGINAFAEKRRAEQRVDVAVTSPMSPTTSPWQRLDALTPHLGNTLMYVYQGP